MDLNQNYPNTNIEMVPRSSEDDQNSNKTGPIIAITNKAHFGQYGVGWSVVLGWAGFICWDWLEL